MLIKPTEEWGSFAQIVTNRSYDKITLGYEYENKQNREDGLPKMPAYFKAQWEGFGGGHGYEIKSLVAPLSVHKLLWKQMVRDNTFCTQPNGMDPEEETNGAIHVSVTRNDMTQSVYENVGQFLHVTMPRQAAIKLSGRADETFDYFSPQRGTGWKNGNTYHYNIINSENSNRYELRLFAAHPDLMLPALETTQCLFEIGQEPITMDGFVRATKAKLKFIDLKERMKSCGML